MRKTKPISSSSNSSSPIIIRSVNKYKKKVETPSTSESLEEKRKPTSTKKTPNKKKESSSFSEQVKKPTSSKKTPTKKTPTKKKEESSSFSEPVKKPAPTKKTLVKKPAPTKKTPNKKEESSSSFSEPVKKSISFKKTPYKKKQESSIVESPIKKKESHAIKKDEKQSERLSPTGKKIIMTKPKPEEWVNDELIDYSLEETKEDVKKISKSSGIWNPNDPFVLHFLLDGFITDNLGNNVVKVFDKFNELLNIINTEWSVKMLELLRNGIEKYKLEKYIIPVIDIQRRGLAPFILEKAKRVEYEDMIIPGGYSSSYGGHTVSFRFQRKLKRITFVN